MRKNIGVYCISCETIPISSIVCAFVSSFLHHERQGPIALFEGGGRKRLRRFKQSFFKKASPVHCRKSGCSHAAGAPLPPSGAGHSGAERRHVPHGQLSDGPFLFRLPGNRRQDGRELSPEMYCVKGSFTIQIHIG